MGINQKTLPGILLCAILAIPCWLLGQQFHLVGSPIFAIILGIIIGSIFTSWKREKTGAGIGFTSKKILQWAVILLGFGLNITQILHVGWISLPVIISTIATSLIVSYVIYRLTHIDSNTAVLIGVGSSICGGSAIAAINFIKEHGGKNIKCMFVIAAPEGLERLHREHPDVQIYVGHLDRELNENAYICPGLGDAGDRIFGTI